MKFFVVGSDGQEYGPADQTLLEQWQRDGRVVPETVIKEAETGFRRSASSIFTHGGGKVIGIDIGTTNSVVAVIQGGKPTVIANAKGARTTPSIVAFTEVGERLVGNSAKQQAALHPDRSVFSVLRMLGTLNRVTVGSETYAPEEILAMLLEGLRSDAQDCLGQRVGRAVITVPLYFNDAQRSAMRDVARLAGVEVVRMISAPTAAALAYNLDLKKNETILIFDLGGGTFDVSVLEIDSGTVEVLAMACDPHLGGDDFDQHIVGFLADEFKKDQGIDLRRDKQAMHRLREAAERAKIEISNVVQTNINLPFIAVDTEGPKHLDIDLTRSKFDDLTRDLVKRAEEPFKRALADAHVEPKDVDEIILVGGSTRIPAIQDLVKRLGGGKAPNRSVNPDEAVAVGAAILAGVLSREVEFFALLDVTPMSLGIQTPGDIFTKLVERHTTIPYHKSETFSTAADGQTAVDVVVYQGEHRIASQNKLLGRFQLTGIPPAPRGVPQIEVEFDIDSNGILYVSARNKDAGTARMVTSSGSGAVPHRLGRGGSEAASKGDASLRLPVVSVESESGKGPSY